MSPSAQLGRSGGIFIVVGTYIGQDELIRAVISRLGLSPDDCTMVVSAEDIASPVLAERAFAAHDLLVVYYYGPRDHNAQRQISALFSESMAESRILIVDESGGSRRFEISGVHTVALTAQRGCSRAIEQLRSLYDHLPDEAGDTDTLIARHSGYKMLDQKSPITGDEDDGAYFQVHWAEDGLVAPLTVTQLDSLLDQLDTESASNAPPEACRPFIAALSNSGGDTMTLALGRPRTALTFTYGHGRPPYLVSVGELEEGAAEVLVFFYFETWSEFALRNTIPISSGRTAAREFFLTGKLPTCVAWEEA